MYVAIAGKQIKGNIVFKFNKNKQRNRNTKKILLARVALARRKFQTCFVIVCIGIGF